VGLISGSWKGLLLDAGIPKAYEVNCLRHINHFQVVRSSGSAAASWLCLATWPDLCLQQEDGDRWRQSCYEAV